jgi:transposase InsO family protein
LRRRVQTTVADPAAVKAPDLIRRDFTAGRINQRYVGDITYLPIGQRGFLYLATVIDLRSRRLAGWAIADHMRTDLVIDALTAAARTRGQSRRSDLPQRRRRPIHIQGRRRSMHSGPVSTVDEQGRQLRRQRPRRVVQRDIQTRNSAGTPRVHRRTRGPFQSMR